jgi:TonB-dependent SusC/RagA subfamily outer membrane receptor
MRNHLQRALVLSIGLILSITLFAKSISGTVRDANGETIVGASVLVQNTTTGTVTDLDGQYQLDVEAGKKIVISYVGYKTQTISVTDSRAVYNVTLEEDSEVLEDVVVVGYGTQKRSDVTGAISSVSAKDIESFSTKSLAESLQGLAAGVSVTKGSGAPGEGAEILIRGAGNLSGMSPLYVVDGVAQEAGFTFNMRDVESIEILKDAGSAAIYGSRAAGGVILITTKRGHQQKTHINLNIRAG